MIDANDAPRGYLAQPADHEDSCSGCDLQEEPIACETTPCDRHRRKDMTDVIFVRIRHFATATANWPADDMGTPMGLLA